MTATVRATAILDAKDQTAQAFASAGARIKQLERNMERLNAIQNRAARSSAVANAAIAKSAGGIDRVQQAGMFLAPRLGGVLAGVGAGAVAAQSVKRFAEVERSMTRVGITGEATQEQITAGIDTMRKLADETAQPFDRMREGMEALTSSGKSFQESLAMLPAIARTAQASGASMADTANSSIALLNHLGIKAEELQLAQDIMAKAGKLGQFEAKDMARYFPSMMPAANAAGFQGIEGLKKLSAVVQTIRSGTGTSEEAAGSAMNIFAKMESEETAKKFKKFGVDLRTEMEKARKEGQNIFETFLDLSAKALKGDLSKLPQLFQDMEVQRGMRPLMATREKIKQFVDGMNDAAGTSAEDLAKVLKNTQAKIDRTAQAWDYFQTSLGGALARFADNNGLNGLMNRLGDQLSGRYQPEDQAEIFRNRNNRNALNEALVKQGSTEDEIRALLDRKKQGMPLPITRIRNLQAERDQARVAGTNAAQRLMLKMDESGNAYNIPGGLVVLREGQEAAREGKTMPAPSKFPSVNAPLPPIRPNGSEQFGSVPPLDFDAAINSAKEAKDDIEAALRAMDLASAGAQAAGGFRNNFSSGLKQVEADTDGFIARLTAKLSNITITPKFNVKPGGLPVGKSPAGQERPPGSTMDGF